MGTLRLSYVLVIAQVGKRGQGNSGGDAAFRKTRTRSSELREVSKAESALLRDRLGLWVGVSTPIRPPFLHPFRHTRLVGYGSQHSGPLVLIEGNHCVANDFRPSVCDRTLRPSGRDDEFHRIGDSLLRLPCVPIKVSRNWRRA